MHRRHWFQRAALGAGALGLPFLTDRPLAAAPPPAPRRGARRRRPPPPPPPPRARPGEDDERPARRYMEQGYRHIRAQVAVPGLATYGSGGQPRDPAAADNNRPQVWEPGPYVRT